jgi:hypothetical protein
MGSYREAIHFVVPQTPQGNAVISIPTWAARVNIEEIWRRSCRLDLWLDVEWDIAVLLTENLVF